MEKNAHGLFGLLLDSMKGLEFIPTPPAPNSPPPTPPKLTPLYTHIDTCTHNCNPMSPLPLPPTFLYSQSGGSGPGI